MTLSSILAAKCRGFPEGSSSSQTPYPSPHRKRQGSLIPLLLLTPKSLRLSGDPIGYAVAAATSADQGENAYNFSYGQPVCTKLFCVNSLLQPMSTDPFSKVRGHRNSPKERECAVSITSVSRSFAVYIRTSNGFYSTCRHSSGMSSGTYVHGESP